MKNILWMLVILGATPKLSAQSYDFSSVTQLLQDSLQVIRGTGGGCALIVIKGDSTIYSRAFGLNFTVDKSIPIGSGTKWLSGAVLMTEVESGRLSLDDSVGKFLPIFSGNSSTMTLRQLFSHTSGLPGNEQDTILSSGSSLTLGQAVNLIALNRPLIALPGTAFAYGGLSMHVAGRIIEISSQSPFPSGVAWDSIFAERLTKPLGMTATNFEGLGVTNNPRISGGAASSAADYIKFLQMILNGGVYQGRQILSSASIEEMYENQTGNVPIIDTPYQIYGTLNPALPNMRYGIGLWREVVDSLTGNLIEAGSQGAFGFSPWIDRSRNIAGVLAVYGQLEKVMPTYLELRKRIRQIIPISTAATLPRENKPYSIQLFQNYPNPFNPTTVISYHLPMASVVRLEVFDLLGRKVGTIVNARQSAGTYSFTLSATRYNMSSGVYFYTLNTDGFSETRRMILVK